MRWLKNQPWNRDPTRQETSDEVEWNLWGKRQPPFNSLEKGDRVFLACPDGMGGSVITWETEVTKVVTARYASKAVAWKILSAEFPTLSEVHGATRSSFLGHDYTAQAVDEGWLIGWSYEPIRHIDVPRAKELRINQTGWLSLEGFAEADLRRWGLQGSSRRTVRDNKRRPPRSEDPLKRKAVEMRAVAVARSELKSLGWTADEIYDTSANRPYDLECRRGTKTVRVEVKGLSGPLTAVTLTRREVEHAKTAACPLILVVVYGISLTPTAGGYKGGGGSSLTWNPWKVADGALTASAFDYVLPPIPAAVRGSAPQGQGQSS